MAAPLARVFSAPACGRFHESKYRERKQTRQAERNPTAGVREFRTKQPRKRRATKISSETAKVLQRAGSSGSAHKRARRHEKVNCASPAVSSFARSRRKLIETGRRDFPERLRCVAVSFLRNCHGARKCGFGAKSGPKGASCSGRAQQGNGARDDYRHRRVTRPSSCTIFPRRAPAGALEDDPSSAGRLPAA